MTALEASVLEEKKNKILSFISAVRLLSSFEKSEMAEARVKNKHLKVKWKQICILVKTTMCSQCTGRSLPCVKCHT